MSVAVEMTPASVSIFEWDGPARSCFVFGHEVLGVDRELLRQADAVLHIPMAGLKNSLNVSSSFAAMALVCSFHVISWTGTRYRDPRARVRVARSRCDA